MAARGFGIFLGVVAILGTLVLQGKWQTFGTPSSTG